MPHLQRIEGIVGRDDTIARLRAILATLHAGDGTLLLISGEPGIGKTTLAEGILAEAQAAGAAVAIGRCYEQGVAPPYAPWPDLLPTLRDEVDLGVDCLPAPFGVGEPGQTAYQVLSAVVRALHAAAIGRPLALVLDDLQWSEQEALDLLDLLTRQLDRVPLLVIVTYRNAVTRSDRPLYGVIPQLQRNRRSISIELTPLDQLEIAQLVAARIGPAAVELTAYLHARTEGNPFYLVALLDELTAGRHLARDADGRWQAPVASLAPPSRVRGLTEQRLARLGGAATSLLEVAAVIGVEWELGLAEAVLGWPEVDLLNALEDLLADGVVVASAPAADRYRFSHPLLRDTIYERQLARRRRHLHARIAAAIDAAPDRWPDPNPAATLAHHAAAADDWLRLARAALAAGDAARDELGVHTAARFYAQALTGIEHLAPDARPWSPSVVAERLGQAHLVLGHHRAATAAFERMLSVGRDEADRDTEVRALCWLSWLARRAYRLVEARLLASQALERAGDVRTPRALALAHWNLGHLEKIEGEPSRAKEHLLLAEQAARAAAAADVVGWSLQHLAQLAVWRGDYAQAAVQAKEALALAQAQRDPTNAAGSAWVLGTALGEQGHYGSALAALHSGLAIARESGERHYLARLLNTAGWVHAEIGDLDTARAWDEQALVAARDEAGDTVTEAERYALINLATDALAAGDLMLAAVHLATFTHLLDDSEYARLRYLNRSQLLRAELAIVGGDGQTGLALAEEAARLATVKGVRKNMAKGWLLAGRALLILNRAREAVERTRRAVALADELGHGSLRWQSRVWCAHAHRLAGSLREAVTLCEQAGQVLTEVAASLPTGALQATLRAAPLLAALQAELATAPVAAPRYPAGLSEREVEVLRLVVQGATNQAIADALSISIKTVNTHMTSIFNKTSSANRAAATSFALRHGLA